MKPVFCILLLFSISKCTLIGLTEDIDDLGKPYQLNGKSIKKQWSERWDGTRTGLAVDQVAVSVVSGMTNKEDKEEVEINSEAEAYVESEATKVIVQNIVEEYKSQKKNCPLNQEHKDLKIYNENRCWQILDGERP